MKKIKDDNGLIVGLVGESGCPQSNDVDVLHVNQEAILANSNTAMFLSRNGKLPCPDAFTNSNYNKDFMKYPEICYGENLEILPKEDEARETKQFELPTKDQ